MSAPWSIGRQKKPPAPKVLSTWVQTVSLGVAPDTVDPTHNHRHARVMGDLGNRLKIRDIVARVANGLNVHGPSLVVNGLCKVLGALRGDKFGVNAETWKEDFELVVRAAVEV